MVVTPSTVSSQFTPHAAFSVFAMPSFAEESRFLLVHRTAAFVDGVPIGMVMVPRGALSTAVLTGSKREERSRTSYGDLEMARRA
jgi:hypothetical protein